MKNMTLNKKLSLLLGVVLLPLLLLVIYMMVSLVKFGTSYNKIVKNITIASGYNFTFRKEIDYIVYSSVINEKTYMELVESESNLNSDYVGDHFIDPYQTINRAKNSFHSLLQEAKGKGSKNSIDKLSWILKSIDRLEIVVREIDENIKHNISYSVNEKLCNNAVLILTEMIQADIQEYIQDEAVEMEQVRQELEERQNQAVTISIYALILIFATGIIVARRITLSVTKPIQELCVATDLVAKGDFSSRTEIEAGDEIQVLTHSFNNMKVKIGKLIDDVKTEQNNLRATELKLLQAQINPHFLYNTMDAIVWLAESGQNKQVVDMVTSLSEFFRTVLSEGKDFITVKEEVSHIQSYLSIQQSRYQDIMEYEIQVDSALYSNQVLKLTLQPIVENALYHGIKNKRGKGKIIVTGCRDHGQMVFQVTDNGIGMSSEQLDNLRKAVKGKGNEHRDGFGLANVNERIQMTYGTEYGLSFESIPGNGTIVTVCLPADEESKNIPLLC